MRFNCHNAEIIEPSFSFIRAVADDEVVTPQGLVAHEVAHFGIGMSRGFLAEQDGILRVADGHGANAHVVMEIHEDGLAEVACLNVRAAHVAVAQRAFDVDFVLVVDDVVVDIGFFFTRGRNCYYEQSDSN